MYDLNQEREEALNKFEEDRELYKLTTYDNYLNKLNEFNKVKESVNENEFTQMHNEISNKIKEIKDNIRTEKAERAKLEESLKFDLAEKKDSKITEFEKTLDNYERRLSIINIKINEGVENKLKIAGAELYKAASEYKNELESIVVNANNDLKERKQKIFDEEVNFLNKYKPVRYMQFEVESEINKLSKYIS